ELVRTAIERGQLMLSTPYETYLMGASFHPTQMITRLSHETQTALEDGYTGLRVTSDMGWVRRRSIKFATLLRYEAVVNDFLAQHRCMGLCRYHRGSFPTAILADIAALHPLVILQGRRYANAQHTLFRDLLQAVDDEADS
ncbi:MAG: MEDS domain-containing protein, partial [Candidatus Bathyarchaeota archaeon]|nr:MEDS domain-containing protein [Candidatus Bathyarchaeota archaeon]